MKNKIRSFLLGALVTFLVIIAIAFEHARFQSIKKYYKDMGYFEFLLSEDKIRLTPDHDK